MSQDQPSSQMNIEIKEMFLDSTGSKCYTIGPSSEDQEKGRDLLVALELPLLLRVRENVLSPLTGQQEPIAYDLTTLKPVTFLSKETWQSEQEDLTKTILKPLNGVKLTLRLKYEDTAHFYFPLTQDYFINLLRRAFIHQDLTLCTDGKTSSISKKNG